MACKRFESALTAHALGAAIEPRLAAHVTDCASCRTTLDARRRLIALVDEDLQTALGVEPPPAFAARIRARIATEPAPSRHWVPPVFVMAAATLALIAGVVMFQHVRAVRERPALPAARLPIAFVHPAPAAVPTVAFGREPFFQARRSSGAAPVGSAPVPETAIVEPEVLVPPGQLEAIRHLAQAVAEGRLEVPDAPVSTAETTTELAVPPLTVEPILVPALDMSAGTPQQHRNGP